MYQTNYFSFEVPSKISQNSTMITPLEKVDGSSKRLYFGQTISQPVKVNTDAVQIVVSSSSELQRESGGQRGSSVWRTNFIIVFVPLLVWGFPIHLLFQKRRLYSMREWLKYLCPCSSPFSSILTVWLAIVSVLFNITVIYALGKTLHTILFKAGVSDDLFELLGDLVRLLPLIIPLDLFWLQGYKLRNFIGSFDRVACHWNPVDGEGAEFIKIGTGRVKLVLMYGMIICVHVLHYISDYYHDDKPDLSTQSIVNQIWEISMVYSMAIIATLILPIYCCFCWAVKYELELTKEYIRSMISARVPPKYAHFDEFKKMSRKIADDTLIVNSTFSILLSVVVVILGIYIFGEVQNLVTTTTNGIMATYKGQAKDTLDPATVRLIFADVIIILLYVGIFGLTIWQAVVTNDEIRSLHVWLNDYVTEPESRLSPELHDGYELLKWYIHSRLEQAKPALLNIMITNIIPPLRNRLVQYQVIH